jgi:hypothetical protein
MKNPSTNLAFYKNEGTIKLTIKLSLTALLLLFIIGEILKAYYGYMNMLFSFDWYQFLEAARAFSLSGISRLSYLPNSSAAMDVIHWSHYFPPFLYAMGVKLFDIQIYDLVIIRFIEILVLMLVLYIVMARFMSLTYAFFVTTLILYAPSFNYIFIAKAYLRWPFIFAMISFLFLVGVLKGNGKRRDLLFAYSSGFFACMAPLSFVSLGVPILIGITLAFFIENFIKQKDSKRMISIFSFFILGVLTPLLVFGINIFIKLDKQNLYDAFYTIVHYGDIVVNEPDKLRTILKMGYFSSTIIVSPYGLSILPIGIAACVSNIRQWRFLNENERSLVRITVIFVAVWIILGMFVSTHFYSARMIWILPFFVLQLIIAIRLKDVDVRGFYTLVVLGVTILSVQALYHISGTPGGIYGIGTAAFLALIISVVTIWILRVYMRVRELSIKQRNLSKVDCMILSSLLIILLTPVFLKANKDIFRGVKLYLSEDRGGPVAERLGREVRQVALQEVKTGERVLTNAPMRELFQKDVRLQCIYFYRSLFSGATKEPADKVFLIGTSPGKNISDYRDVKVGKNIYYRGFIYHFEKRIELMDDIYLLIGIPFDFNDNEKVIYPTEYVSKDEVNRYLNWRVSNGLSVR